jgi:four helix bundle protein
MKIKRFEDLECWKEARILLNMIYILTKKGNFSKDYRLKDQIVGSGISIMNNVAEGFDSQSNNEFMRFLKIARRSISEVENCLYVAIDQIYISQEEFKNTFTQAEKERQLVDGMLRYLRKYKQTQRS